jgi:foldase protein PrsA
LRINKGLLMVAAVVLVAVVSGCGIIRKNPEAVKNSAVAEVNGYVITKEVFDKNFDLYRTTYESQYGTDIWNQDIDGKKFIDVVKEQVVEKLISDRLVLEDAKDKGIDVTDEEVEQEVKSIKDYFEDEQKFLDFIATQNLSEEEFTEETRRNLIIMKYREKVVESVAVSEEDIKKYYDENPKEFKKDTVKASHILLDSREEAEKVLAKAKAGEDFGSLAAEYSVEPGAETTKGDLGEFGYGYMVQPFEEAAFALDEGEISDIVETQFGYHIIKVYEKTIVDPIPFEEAKDDIEAMLMYYKQEEVYSQAVAKLREQAEIKTYPKNM